MQPQYITNEIPYGYCHCGCGQKTKIAIQTQNEYGWVKGEPLRYINGHNSRKYQDGVAPWVETRGLKHPYGVCQCGCGKDAPIATKTNFKAGALKGQPQAFCPGHGKRNGSPREEFWKHVTPGEPDECWEWQGPTNDAGYGIVGTSQGRLRAHRVSYELHNGPIPDEILVCHECDNPPCVNPNHLWLGTNHQNMLDKAQKGRNYNGGSTRGENHPAAKMTAEKVKEVRRLADSGVPSTQVAKRMGIHQATAYAIIHRKLWKHVK